MTADPSPDAPLIFHGVVDVNADPDDPDEYPYVPRIGGRNVISEISDHWAREHRDVTVTVGIADETFYGKLGAEVGWRGYSEYTPAEPAELTAGPHNLLTVLTRHHGNKITMWVSGQPINVMEPMQEVTLSHRWRGHLPGAKLTMFRSDAKRLDAAGYLLRDPETP